MELQAPIMYIHIDTKNTHKTNFSHKTKKMLSHIIPHLQQFPKKIKNILLICIYIQKVIYLRE